MPTTDHDPPTPRGPRPWDPPSRGRGARPRIPIVLLLVTALLAGMLTALTAAVGASSAHAAAVDRTVLTWNMQGAGEDGDDPARKWEVLKKPLLSDADAGRADVALLQEAGPMDVPGSADHQGTLSPKIVNGGSEPIDKVEHYTWKVSGQQTYHIYRVEWDTNGHRVNPTIVTREPADDTVLVGRVSAGLRPMLGVQFGNDVYFTLHSDSPNGNDAMAQARRAWTWAQAQTPTPYSVMVGGDFNREPDQLGNLNGLTLHNTGKETHTSKKELDYALAGNVQQQGHTNPVRLAEPGRFSDHSPVLLIPDQACTSGATRVGGRQSAATPAAAGAEQCEDAVVSMGDSYISGEAGRWQGNGFNGQYSYKAKEGSAYGTDRTAFDCTGSGVDEKCEHDPKRVYGNTGEGEEMCHRSDVAPIKSIGDELGIPQKRRFNIACSGATTEDVTSRTFKGEKPQVEQLAELAGRYRLKYVVLSIGGNDLGFSKIAKDCVAGYEGNLPCSDNGREEIERKLGDVRDAVDTTVKEIRETLSGAGQDGTKIVIQGYPNPVPSALKMRYENAGWQRELVGGCPLLDEDVDWLHHDVVPGLNRGLSSVAQSRDAIFLNTESAFAGHQLCERGAKQAGEDDTLDNPPDATAAEWVRWIPGLMDWFPWTQGEAQEAAHPNAFGQQALGTCLRRTLEATNDRSKGSFDCRGAPNTGPDKVRVSEEGTDQSVRLMPLGDSITYGKESSDGTGYRDELYDALEDPAGRQQVNFVGSVRAGKLSDRDNEGHPGKRIDEIAGHAKCYVPRYQPNVITLHAGTNDVNQEYELSTAPQRMKKLITDALEDSPKAVVVVAKVIPTGKAGLQPRIDAFNAKLPGIVSDLRADGKHVVLVDTNDVKVGDGLQDDAHPNDHGYAKLGYDFHSGIVEAADRGWIKKPDPQKPATKCDPDDPDEDQSKAGPGWRALGVVAPGMDYPSGRTDLMDFDGDGRDDYVRMSHRGKLRVALNRKSQPGKPRWEETDPSFDTVGSRKGWNYHFADFNGDGRDDVVVVPPRSTKKQNVELWLNKGPKNGVIQWDYRIPFKLTNVPQEAVRFADVNGDGRADYLRVGKDGSVHAYYNLKAKDGGYHWKEHRNWAPGVPYGSRDRLRLADVDGDGRADYLMVGRRGAVHAYINEGGRGHGGFTEHRNFVKETGFPGDEVAFRDISGDGRSDYVVVYDGGSVRAWLNRGGNT
ncbi:FG-GAP-like repeat-containing protein [Streptomyces sp. NPDC007983]|uniref:FG-GAP-like repeat-containing protein n=1 Tax=Streptomyces sp. NPDC007983 TaxID=3364800 RepID=UPI0036DFC619